MSHFWYHFTHIVIAGLPRLAARFYRSGDENIPREGAALLLANHISHFDPQLLAWGVPRCVHYMADKPLLEIPILGWMLRKSYAFPIDRTKNDRAAIRTAMEKLKAGEIVGIFPEAGIRHGKHAVLGGEGELPIGTAALWKMMDVPVIPMVILGSDQLYSLKNYFRRPRVFVRAGKMLPPPGKDVTREELRERLVAAWREIYDSLLRDYNIQPDEFPQSAHKRWGVPEPEFKKYR